MVFEIELSIKLIVLALELRKLIVGLISGVGTDKIFIIVCSVGNYHIVAISFLLHADRSNTSIWYVDTNVTSRKLSFISNNDIKLSYTVFNYSFH